MKNKIILNIDIADDNWFKSVDFDVFKTAEELKDLTFNYVADNVEHELLQQNKDFILNVCLSNNNEVQRLNREFRHIDNPTNVLSFANLDDDSFWDSLDNEPEIELGDIIIAFETLQNEAAIKNITIYAHFCHLLVHGFLHILGFDHQEDDEAEAMETLETEILAAFSIENPYQDTNEI